MTANRKSFLNNLDFRATGKGHAVRIPSRVTPHLGSANYSRDWRLPQTWGRSTAVLTNRDLPTNHPNRERHIWLTDLSTSWRVDGDYGQSVNVQTFYPKYYQQTPLVLRGICENQHQYDMLVEFVETHHFSALDASAAQSPRQDRFLDDHPVVFSLIPYEYSTGVQPGGGATTWRKYSWIQADGYILGFKGGHERFNFAPTFEMQFLVTNDYRTGTPTYTVKSNKVLQQAYKNALNVNTDFENPQQQREEFVPPTVAADITDFFDIYSD